MIDTILGLTILLILVSIQSYLTQRLLNREQHTPEDVKN